MWKQYKHLLYLQQFSIEKYNKVYERMSGMSGNLSDFKSSNISIIIFKCIKAQLNQILF